MDEDAKMTTLRNRCLANAEASLGVAERELDKGADHICFHLALLALEEIGKANLIAAAVTAATAGRDKRGLSVAMDDHVKKIFWALWGGMFRGEKFTKEQIEKDRGLATGLHEHRLYYLYTDPNNPLMPEEKMREGEARNLVELVRTRLETEKTIGIRPFEGADVETLKWFFTATEDQEKRRHIFSGPSLAKFAELSDPRDWMQWLRDTFEQHDALMHKFGAEELSRERPTNEEARRPKYKMRVRVQSPSHTIKANVFDKWNAEVHDIKLRAANRKDMPETAKSEVIMEFTFPKALPPAMLWEHGLFMSKTLAVAFNIGTRGVFWWNLAKDLEKYYETIEDVERDPDGSVKLKIVVGKRLALNWDEVHLALNEEELSRVSMVGGYLMRYGKRLEECLNAYALGMTLLSKTDIHLRMEPNAFEQFWKAIKSALVVFGDWDGADDIKAAVKRQFDQFGEIVDFDRIMDLGVALDLDDRHQGIHPITLTEVIAMKQCADIYLIRKIADYFKTTNPDDLGKDEPPTNHRPVSRSYSLKRKATRSASVLKPLAP